ncbi:GNAT family N-acetyltransferase [Aeoliella sp.]|uniref:GNAT family N-acetyltransferase n=1 Tax=Aeoliella sp. TaxID=2795800 RepID=UPI003CCC3E4D
MVDIGIGQANSAAAPLHEVQPICCFARTESGTILGGAVGRWWGTCCELQQLWVAPEVRREGIGRELLTSFERHAIAHGCVLLFLDTFSFQAPAFYEAHGYHVEFERLGYPDGIARYHLAKQLESAGAEG